MKRASPPHVTSWRADCRQTQVRPTSQVVSVLYCVCSLYQFGLLADTGQTHQSGSQCFIKLYCVCSLYQFGLPADTGQIRQSVSQCFIVHLFIIPIWIAGRHRPVPPVSQSVFYIASVHYTKLDCRQTQVRPTSQSISVLYCVCSLYQVGLPAGTG